MPKRSEPFSFLPFCEVALYVVDFCRTRRIDAAKIQSLLKQTKPAAEVGQRMDSAGCAQPLEDTRISFAFGLLYKDFDGASHLFTIHSRVLGIRPKIMPCVLLIHRSEAFASGRLYVSKGGDFAPSQLVRNAPFKLLPGRAEFLLNETCQNHRTVGARGRLPIQLCKRVGQHDAGRRVRSSCREQRETNENDD